MDTYKLQKRGGRGVAGMKHREEDFVEELFISLTHENVLFITNKGRMYKLKCYEIPEGGRTARGANIVNILPLESDEKIAYMIKVRDFDEDHFLVMATRNGLIKRTPLDAYRNVRKNGLIAITLNENDELASARLTDGVSELLLATENGMSIRFDEQQVRPMSRTARGVHGIKLRGDDHVISMARLRQGAYVMTVTEKGQGRRTEISEYRPQTRGGFGKLNYKQTEKHGKVAGVRVVGEDEDLILIADDGIIIRIRVNDVNVMSRYASGVRVMRLAEGSKVVTFARAEHDEEQETEAVEQKTAEEADAAEVAQIEKDLEEAENADRKTEE